MYLAYWLSQKRKKVRERHTNFKRNGGVLLQNRLSSSDGTIQKTRIFTISELKKATDNFSDNSIIGRGGQGTVYRGVLTDGEIVAVKKSRNVDDSRLEQQFMNEVVILSQINHRNVVKLLGCCLETEVPLLVYEFITNGTLSEHIHKQEARLPWKTRLQIAAESAGAIAYLHSFAAVPIYHRDIKSSNILLDEKYNAKVSDFGISRTVEIEQTHLTTLVQGTFGYLDPEYFNSSQFTEKSDVYSFGVVLIELLTSMRPIFVGNSNERRHLKEEFVEAMESSRLLQMLDPLVSEQAKEDEVMTVAKLARSCLNTKGENRPTMKKVLMVLEGLRSCRGACSDQDVFLEGDRVSVHEGEADTASFCSSSPLYSS